MPTFTPPTRNEAITGKEQVVGGDASHASMWRHYGSPIPVGYTVLITSGVATTSPGRIAPTTDDIAGADAGSGDADLAYFRGGQEYTITAAEDTILKAAGYTTSTS